MKIIRDPKVYLVGRTTVIDRQIRNFLADEGVVWETDALTDGDAVPELAGRICYMSYGKPRPGGNKAYLDNIKESGHGSVLEHPVWNFVFSGISRSLSHELVRHRAGWAYSQVSQRYVDESVAEYVVPPIIANDPELVATWVESVEKAHGDYLNLVERLMAKLAREDYERYLDHVSDGRPQHAMGFHEWHASKEAFGNTLADRTTRRKAARGTARSVLPNATETKIFASANARAIRHFVEMRASRYADVEIRKLAVAVLRVMRQEAPNLFGDYTLTALPDGTFEANTPTRKV